MLKLKQLNPGAVGRPEMEYSIQEEEYNSFIELGPKKNNGPNEYENNLLQPYNDYITHDFQKKN